MPGTAAHPRARYTKAQKAAAVGQALATSAEAASEALGIPRRTIGYWLDQPEFAELRHKTREAVADEMWTAIQVGIREVAKGIAGDAPLRDKATALGILYDKHALLTGGSTSRSESRDLTGTPSDEDVYRWLRQLDDIGRGADAAQGVAAPAEG